jgi:hypothetical protein
VSFEAKTLFELLPAIHRIRDAEIAQGEGLERGPLEELIAVFAEQVGVAQENLEQLYDDLFIETCADWVVAYIGDLIGYEPLHQVVPSLASPRAEVAHTIALRRRKGTALVLEQLARDVTGWDARAACARAMRWSGSARPSTPPTARWTCAASSPGAAATTSPTWACTCGASAPTRTATRRPSATARGATARAR